MIKKFALLCLAVITIAACSSSDDSNGGGGGGTDPYNRTVLLTNLADNLIIPALEDFQIKLSAMDIARGNFVNNPTASELQNLSNAWLEAYKIWQHVEMFNIGRAESLNQFYFFMNIYPTNTSDIETAVSTGSFDLNLSNFHDAQGFPAIDYLIHSTGALERFTTDANAAGYVTYLNAIVSQMVSLTQQVVNDWQNSYRDAFIANTASSSTGSVDKIVNDYIFYYEKGFRANKFGIPAGVFSGSASADKVEGLYRKDVSKTLALEAMTAIENMFIGRTYNGTATGESFKTYLEFLNRSDIVTSVNNAFAGGRTAINNLPENFYQQVLDDNTQMTLTYDAIQQAVVLLKVDMAQAFDVSIDFVDADGD